MNFEHMPELKLQFGYYYALGLMAAVAASVIMYFKSKRWL
jgi:magnesium transporter